MGCTFASQKQIPLKQENRRNKLQTIDCRRKSTKVVDVMNENVHVISKELTEQQIQFAVQKLIHHQLFCTLSEEELKKICSQMIYVEAKHGEYIFHQGDSGSCFFLIEEGSITVQVNKKNVCTLNSGGAFGELALLFRTSRSASILCNGVANKFLVMKPVLYKATLQKMKTDEYSRNKEIIEKISLFQCLTNKQKFALANTIKNLYYKAGDIIFKVGDLSQGLFIIAEGQVSIQIKGKEPLVLNKLEIFGQNSLKDNSLRAGTAICATDVQCSVIGKKNIEKALGSSIQNLVFYNTKKWALVRTSAFNDYDSIDMNRLILSFQTFYFEKNQKIPRETYKGIVISLEGSINDKPQGSIFNAQGWISKSFQSEILVKNQPGNVAFISYEKLQQLTSAFLSKKLLFKASQKCIPQRLDQINLKDFQYLKKLGEGQFGQVYLVKNENLGGHLYAIKCLSKKAIKEEEMQSCVVEEKKILQKAIFPFIVGFVKAFHDKENIFLLMEYLKGKQMFDVIREMPTLNKPIARYYFGCILLSIEYLHANNIIYRDLKPENSVVDHRGKAYLIDMGTAKALTLDAMFKTFTIIGTPHYMAPQVFEGKGYSFQVDYWSLGILLYEFVSGRLPFGQNIKDDPYAIYSLLKKSKVDFPKTVVDEKVKNLVNLLLTKDPKARGQNVSFQKIKNHPYFEGFSWEDLLEERILPPYIPKSFKSENENSLKLNQNVEFLKYIYKNKSYGEVTEWNQDFGI